jgi:hypothetical protein
MENPNENRKGKKKANELEFQVVAAILSPLSLYGGNRKMKLPLLHNTRIHAPEGHFRNSHCSTIRRMPGDRTSLHLDARLAIPTRVLCFEVS